MEILWVVKWIQTVYSSAQRIMRTFYLEIVFQRQSSSFTSFLQAVIEKIRIRISVVMKKLANESSRSPDWLPRKRRTFSGIVTHVGFFHEPLDTERQSYLKNKTQVVYRCWHIHNFWSETSYTKALKLYSATFLCDTRLGKFGSSD